MFRRLHRAAATLAAFFAALPLAAGAATYSNATLKGTYSFLNVLHTANTSTAQFATLGILKFDGAGNVTATASDVSQGVVTANAPVTGTYSVGPNGLGTLSIPGGPQFAILLDEFVGPVATDVQILNTSDTTNEVVSGHAVLQSTTPITYSLKNTKGMFFVKTVIFPANPSFPEYQAIGVETLDGKGNVKITYAQMDAGQYSLVTATGTYTINADGAGTISLLSGTTRANSITVANSKGGMAVEIGVDANLIVTGEAIK
jgi:hypothetical protein